MQQCFLKLIIRKLIIIQIKVYYVQYGFEYCMIVHTFICLGLYFKNFYIELLKVNIEVYKLVWPSFVYLKIEKAQGDVLNELLSNILGIEFGSELKLKGVLLFDILAHHL